MGNKQPLILDDYRVFSGADIDVYLIAKGSGEDNAVTNFRRIANLSTFSYSSYRNKQSVTPIGYTNPKGMTRGPRTIAGTMVFTVFDKSVFLEVIGAHFEGEKDSDGPVLIDQLPPVDIYLVFNNEYGHNAHMIVFGLEFLNEGQIHSIDDLYTEATVNYIAKDFFPMRPINESLKNKVNKRSNIHRTIAQNDIARMKDKLKKMRQEFY